MIFKTRKFTELVEAISTISFLQIDSCMGTDHNIKGPELVMEASATQFAGRLIVARRSALVRNVPPSCHPKHARGIHPWMRSEGATLITQHGGPFLTLFCCCCIYRKKKPQPQFQNRNCRHNSNYFEQNSKNKDMLNKRFEHCNYGNTVHCPLTLYRVTAKCTEVEYVSRARLWTRPSARYPRWRAPHCPTHSYCDLYVRYINQVKMEQPRPLSRRPSSSNSSRHLLAPLHIQNSIC